VPRYLAQREADRGSFRNLTGAVAASEANRADRSGTGLIRRDPTRRELIAPAAQSVSVWIGG
jgi:hypothetical protein